MNSGAGEKHWWCAACAAPLLQVHYCGLCHSDVFTKLGLFGNAFPRAPGHEVSGVVDAVGPNVTKWSKGDR